jgi:prepilin-type processing-associated H-X9-DG protein
MKVARALGHSPKIGRDRTMLGLLIVAFVDGHVVNVARRLDSRPVWPTVLPGWPKCFPADR